MGKIREITEQDRRKHEIEVWLVTDPNTPKPPNKGVIARIFRQRRNNPRRWAWKRTEKY